MWKYENYYTKPITIFFSYKHNSDNKFINNDYINELINHQMYIKKYSSKNFSSKNKDSICPKLKIQNKKVFVLWKFIMMILINFIASQKLEKNNRYLQNNNYITLIIIGNKYQNIINSKFLPLPDVICLNDNVYTENSADFNGSIYIDSTNKKEKSIIKLIWEKKLNSLANIFKNISSIIKIDLSMFDSSEVTSMDSMFYDCLNLQSINFGNIDTSNVDSMYCLFCGSQSLTSIDLSKFDTSKVKTMSFMFYGCSSLISVDLSSFNTSKVTTMRAMFYDTGLEQLDFSNMDLSKVTNMEFFISHSYLITSLNLNVINSNKVNNIENLCSYCYSLESLNMSNFDTSGVLTMDYLFFCCYSLISLDLSTFNTSNLIKMRYMFAFSSITDINFSGFDTSNVYSMAGLFYECLYLESLNLNSFTFNQVDLAYMFFKCKSLKNIQFSEEYKLVEGVISMFYECSSLTSIDLYNFDFGIIENMEFLFYGCTSLISINFEYIDTFSVTNMENLFYGCNSLTSLNLESWITSSVETIKSMFYDCISLISIDLSNFDTSSVIDMKDLFYNCIKITSIILKNFETTLVKDMSSMFYGCSSLLSLNLSSFDTSNVFDMKSMFYNCKKLTSLDLSNFDIQNVVNLNYMFSGCLNLGYIKFNNFNDKSIESIDGLFLGVPDNAIICIEGLNSDILLEEITEGFSNLKCPIYDCSNNWKIFKKRILYNTGICINDCKNDELNKYEYEFFCYLECPKGTHSSKNDKYLCEKNVNNCVQKYPFINTQDESCAEICNSEDFFHQKCKLNIYNAEIKDFIIDTIISEIENNTMQNLINEIIEGQMDSIVTINESIFQLTSSFNQNNKIYKNISSIKLKECENIIKEKYNIPKNDSLIIFKVEKNVKHSLIPLIEYVIFNPMTKEKLDLNDCRINKKNIDIYIPVTVNETTIYEHNPNHYYYNDVCNTKTTEYGTDITLYDRKNEYNNNNLSLCSIDCTFSDYDNENKIAICKCKAKSGMHINSNFLLNKLAIKKRVIIFDILKCITLVFSKKGIIQNLGNYIISLILILFIISGIYFLIKGYKIVCEQIEDIIRIKKILNNINREIIDKNQYKEIIPDLNSTSEKNKRNNKKNHNKYNKQYQVRSDFNLSKDILNNKASKDNEKMETQNKTNYEDFEINNISYEEALVRDKRVYCEIYLSLIKANHILIFTFSTKKDYNPYIIKICLFSFSFALQMFINALFFNDSTMHEIYKDKGVFNFSFVLPHILYSIIIVSICNVFLKRLYLPQKDILNIKYENNYDILNAKVFNVINCLKIKFISFFIVNIILLLFFWYYLSSFCAVYKNTQIYLFEVVLISYSFSLLYPLIIFLLPSLFRISSLRKPGKCIYTISKFLQML